MDTITLVNSKYHIFVVRVAEISFLHVTFMRSCGVEEI